MTKEQEYIKLLCKHYHVDNITGTLKEDIDKRCGNEDEIDKLNKYFDEFKENKYPLETLDDLYKKLKVYCNSFYANTKEEVSVPLNINELRYLLRLIKNDE